MPLLSRRSPGTFVAIALMLTVTSVASAKPPAAQDKKPEARKRPTTASPAAGIDAMGTGMSNAIPGLPHYVQPRQYSVDLVIRGADGKDMVMHRSVDEGRVRTDIDAEGQQIAMIELGDEKGTTLTLMPKEKRGMKQSREALEALGQQAKPATATAVDAVADPRRPEGKIEDLGEETLDGHVARKLRMSSEEGSALGWFDKETGAPLKMESEVEGKQASIAWKNMKPGPQPAALFVEPKGYEIMDMDEMMSQMKSMGGMPGGMGAGGMLGALGGMGGMGGGVKGMAGGMAGNFGSQLGANLGGALGASLGGPLGAMAGQYLGGRIGGMIGRKAADIAIPGK